MIAIADAPDWLVRAGAKARDEARRSPHPRSAPASGDSRERKYGLGVLADAVAAIAQAPKGERHNTILKRARTVGGYVASGCITEAEAEAALVDAGESAGKPHDEVLRAVQGALRLGIERPLKPPEPRPTTAQAREADEPPPFEDDAPPPDDADGPTPWAPTNRDRNGDPVLSPEQRAAEAHALRIDGFRKLAAAMHIRRVARAFVVRLESPIHQQFIPWPGGRIAWPDNESNSIPPNALLPADIETRHKRGEAWDRLWQLVGPLFPDRLIVVIGRPGRGKSGLALQVAEAAAALGFAVLYASAEMGPDDLVARLLTVRAQGTDNDVYDAGIAHSAVLMGRAPIEDVRAASEALAEHCPGLYLWTPTGADRTPQRLREATQAVSFAEAGRPPLVIVDYLQRFVPPSAERREDVSALSSALRDLSRPGGLGDEWPGAAVLALSSTARSYYAHFESIAALHAALHSGDVEGTGKETGEIEYDAPLLLGLTTEPREGSGPRPGLIVVAKNRHGGTGEVALRFSPACGRFREATAAETAGEVAAEAARTSRPPKATPRKGGRGRGRPGDYLE